MYPLQDNFWWHGSINNDIKEKKFLEKFGIELSRRNFMTTEGAIPKYVL